MAGVHEHTENGQIAVKCGYMRSRDNNKPRIHIQAEMKRLEDNLHQKMFDSKSPQRRAYTPYTYDSLEPYKNMHTAKFLVDLPDDVERGYHIRQLATGLCDPWTNLTMDNTQLPKIETKALVQHAVLKPSREDNTKRPATRGSTRLPKFPVVSVPPEDLHKKNLFYSDVPKLRQKLFKFREQENKYKESKDYKRTVQDFYRMELDRLDQIHPSNRERMQMTYKAYLHNTPGSRKAIQDCLAAMTLGQE